MYIFPCNLFSNTVVSKMTLCLQSPTWVPNRTFITIHLRTDNNKAATAVD